jgi:hypothetical protein
VQVPTDAAGDFSTPAYVLPETIVARTAPEPADKGDLIDQLFTL